MNHLMEVFPEKISALAAAVSVVNGEEAAVGPVFEVLFLFRLHYVQDYGHSVLVVVTHYSLMRVRRVRVDQSVTFRRTFSYFYLLEIYISST